MNEASASGDLTAQLTRQPYLYYSTKFLMHLWSSIALHSYKYSTVALAQDSLNIEATVEDSDLPQKAFQIIWFGKLAQSSYSWAPYYA